MEDAQVQQVQSYGCYDDPRILLDPTLYRNLLTIIRKVKTLRRDVAQAQVKAKGRQIRLLGCHRYRGRRCLVYPDKVMPVERTDI